MIKINKDFDFKAITKVRKMLDELSVLANNFVYDENDFEDVCKSCSINKDELTAIINGDVSDMSLYDYFKLIYYFRNGQNNMKYGTWKHDELPHCKRNKKKQFSCCNNDTPSNFIDNVNKQLPKNSKINKKEALKAKKVFDKDKVLYDYDTAAKQANVELFGTEANLSNLPIGDLRYFIYKNHWENEFDKDLLGHKQSLLTFLYHKLEDKISQILLKGYNVSDENIKKVNDTVKEVEETLLSDDYIEKLKKLVKDVFK